MLLTLKNVAVEIFAGVPASRQRGFDAGTDSPKALIPLVSLGDIKEGRVSTLSEMEPIEVSGPRVKEKFAVRSGDILVASRGSVLKVGWVRENSAGAIASNNLIVVRPGPKVLAGYLFGVLRSAAYAKMIAGLSRGVTDLLSITTRDLSGVTVPVPPLEEQQRLASFISDAEDAYYAAVDAAALRREIGLQAVENTIFEMLTTKTHEGAN